MRCPRPPDELSHGAEHVHELPGPGGEPLLTVERSDTLPLRLGAAPMRAAVAITRADLERAEQDFAGDLLPYTLLLAAAPILAGWAEISVGLRPPAAEVMPFAASLHGEVTLHSGEAGLEAGLEARLTLPAAAPGRLNAPTPQVAGTSA